MMNEKPSVLIDLTPEYKQNLRDQSDAISQYLYFYQS
jgi:hypothetical protein